MSIEFTKQIENDIAVIKLVGKIIENQDGDGLLDEVDECTANGTNNFILNLKRLDYINSSGLNTFISILTKSRNAGGDTILCGINEKVSKLFLITKLNTLFTIVDNEQEAQNVFSKKLNI